MNEYIEAFKQLPSKTGKDLIDLEEYAKLPRVQSYKSIEAFLEAARRSTKDVHICFIVAEWGEGKTSVYESLLKKRDVIKSDVVIPISTKRLITHIKEKVEDFLSTASFGIRLFGCLIYAIKDVIENDLFRKEPFNRIKIRSKHPEEKPIDFIVDVLKSIFESLDRSARVFIFLDEFEDILDEDPQMRYFLRQGLLEIINGEPRCLVDEPLFAGRFHILIAVTPPAYDRITSETSADARRLFGQRALPIFLEKLDRKNAYQYILGILKYCWGGNLPKVPFSEVGMFNTIYISTLGNPRSIINLLEILLTYSLSKAPHGKCKIIDPEVFVNALLDRRIGIYGGEVHLINKNILDKLHETLRKKCEEHRLNFDKCKALLYLLLSTLAPISIEDIKRKFGFDEYSFRIYTKVIASSFHELWGIEQPFIFLKRVVSGIDEIRHKEVLEDVYPILSKIISALEFYEVDSHDFSLRSMLYAPYRYLSELSTENRPLFQNYVDFFTSSSPEVRDEGLIIASVDRNIMDVVKLSYEDYVMLSQAAINLFYPSPSFLFLDFIKDPSLRFKIGMSLTCNLTRYEQELREGVLALLKDGGEGRRIKIDEKLEPYSASRLARVIHLTYSEVGQQYKMKAFIFCLLRTSKEEVKEKIEKIFDEMKESYTPLLIIFSWNPLPIEVKNVIETYFSPQRGYRRIFHYLEFPLSEFQCHQLVGYILAQKYGFKIKKEKWMARASRILDEIKFEKILRDFIRSGDEVGYTLRYPILTLKKLKLDDIPYLLRVFLLTEGSIEDRFKTLQYLEDRFRIYGKDFPLSPIDIETEEALRLYVNELKNIGLIEVEEGNLRVKYHPVEERILSILREYKLISKDNLSDLFIQVIHHGQPLPSIDIYLNMLRERGRVVVSKDAVSLRTRESQDKDFESLKNTISYLENEILNLPYGFLVSIKQRKVNVIMVKECLNELKKLAEDLQNLIYDARYEDLRIRRQLLLNLLVNQLEEIVDIIREFHKKLGKEDYQLQLPQIIRSLENLEEALNNLSITAKRIKIKEKEELNQKLSAIENIKGMKYTRDDVGKLASKFVKTIPEDYYQEFKGCRLFDVKIVRIHDELQSLRKYVNRHQEFMKSIEEKIKEIRGLRNSISKHKILTFQYKGTFSSILQDWIKQNMGKVMEGVHMDNIVEVEEVGLEELFSILESKSKELRDMLSKLDEIANHVEEINKEEGEFSKTFQDVRELTTKLLSYFDGVEDNVKVLLALEQNIKDVEGKIREERADLEREIASIRFSRDKLHEYVNRLTSSLSTARQLVTDIKRREADIFNKSMEKLKDKVFTLHRLLSLIVKKAETALRIPHVKEVLMVESRKVKDMEDELPKDINDLSKRDNEKLRGLHLKMENFISRLGEELRKLIITNGLLEEEELKALEILYKMKEKELDINDIMEVMKRDTKKEEHEIQEILINLSRKGFLILKVIIE